MKRPYAIAIALKQAILADEFTDAAGEVVHRGIGESYNQDLLVGLKIDGEQEFCG